MEIERNTINKLCRVLRRKFVDILLWLPAFIFSCLTLVGIIPPKHIGFSCKDVLIQHPFEGDTITGAMLFGSLVFGPALLFFVTEAAYNHPITIRTHFQHCYKQWLTVLGNFLLGFVYVLFITELMKTLVGELRPHFLQTCKPDWSNINCSQGIITEYKCTNKGPYWLVQVDIHKSFPSGHTSLSFYTLVFVSLYAQVRIRHTSRSHLIKSWVQLLFLSWTLVCSLTRISDYCHFWWDVLAGSLVGIIGGFVIVRYFVHNNFDSVEKEEEESDVTVSSGIISKASSSVKPNENFMTDVENVVNKKPVCNFETETRRVK